jgi:hypothetical protein
MRLALRVRRRIGGSAAGAIAVQTRAAIPSLLNKFV